MGAKDFGDLIPNFHNRIQSQPRLLRDESDTRPVIFLNFAIGEFEQVATVVFSIDPDILAF